MDKLEYENALKKELHKLKRRLSINTYIAFGGMLIAKGISLYNTVKTHNLANELIKEPPIEEIYFSEIHPEIEKEKGLKKILQEEYQPKVEASKKTEKISDGLLNASAAYFLLGCAIPLAFYTKKKKSLEKKFYGKE